MTKDELVKIREKTSSMTEFVIKIDRGIHAPIINTGVCMTITTADKESKDYLIINVRNLGSFLPVDKLVAIKDALTANDQRKLMEVIQNEGLNIRLVVLPKYITRAHLSGKCAGALVGAVTHDMYSSINNEMFGIDGFFYTCPFSGTNYRNFAARVSIYLTNAPAGLGKCTGIEVIPNSSKYVGGVEKPEDKIVLVDFAPANKAVIVAKVTDIENKIFMPIESCDLIDEDVARRAAFIEAAVDAYVEAEKLVAEKDELVRKFNEATVKASSFETNLKVAQEELSAMTQNLEAANKKIAKLTPKKPVAKKRK
jgi:hypothetical protein